MPNITEEFAADALDAMDDLLGEAIGSRPVQDWGKVNRVMVDLGRMAKAYPLSNNRRK